MPTALHFNENMHGAIAVSGCCAATTGRTGDKNVVLMGHYNAPLNQDWLRLLKKFGEQWPQDYMPGFGIRTLGEVHDEFPLLRNSALYQQYTRGYDCHVKADELVLHLRDTGVDWLYKMWLFYEAQMINRSVQRTEALAYALKGPLSTAKVSEKVRTTAQFMYAVYGVYGGLAGQTPYTSGYGCPFSYNGFEGFSAHMYLQLRCTGVLPTVAMAGMAGGRNPYWSEVFQKPAVKFETVRQTSYPNKEAIEAICIAAAATLCAEELVKPKAVPAPKPVKKRKERVTHKDNRWYKIPSKRPVPPEVRVQVRTAKGTASGDFPDKILVARNVAWSDRSKLGHEYRVISENHIRPTNFKRRKEVQ